MRTNEGVADCLPAWDRWTGSDYMFTSNEIS